MIMEHRRSKRLSDLHQVERERESSLSELSDSSNGDDSDVNESEDFSDVDVPVKSESDDSDFEPKSKSGQRVKGEDSDAFGEQETKPKLLPRRDYAYPTQEELFPIEDGQPPTTRRALPELKAKKDTPVWTVQDPFGSLSDELLVCIFSHLGQGGGAWAWNQCSRRLHKIASLPSARARYLLAQYPVQHILYYAVEVGSICDGPTIDHLLSLGAKPSRYFFQCITLAYTRAAPKWIDNYWCKPETIPFKHWLGLLRLGTSLYPSLAPTANKDDVHVLQRFVQSEGKTIEVKARERRKFVFEYHNGQRHRVLVPSNNVDINPEEFAEVDQVSNELIQEVLALFNQFHLRPFCPYDRKLTQLIVQAAAFLPEILPIAVSAGMSITDDLRRSIFNLFVEQRKGTMEARCDDLKKLYAEAPALRPDLQAVASSMFATHGWLKADTLPLLVHLDTMEVLPYTMGKVLCFALYDNYGQGRYFRTCCQHRKLFSSLQAIDMSDQEREGCSQAIVMMLFFYLLEVEEAETRDSEDSEDPGCCLPDAKPMTLVRITNLMVAWKIAMTEELATKIVRDRPSLAPGLASYAARQVKDDALASKLMSAIFWHPAAGPSFALAVRNSKVFDCDPSSDIASLLLEQFAIDMSRYRVALSKSAKFRFLSPLNASKTDCWNSAPFTLGVYESTSKMARKSCSFKEHLGVTLCLGEVLVDYFAQNVEVMELLLLHATLGNNDRMISRIMSRKHPLSLNFLKILSSLDLAPPLIFRWIYRSQRFMRNADSDMMESPRDTTTDLRKWQQALDRLLNENLKRSKAQDRRMSAFATAVKRWRAEERPGVTYSFIPAEAPNAC